MAQELERGERLQIMLSQEELGAVDDFRFRNRMPSRAAAIRDILRLGLASVDVTSAPAGTKSQDVGVLTATRKEPRAKRNGQLSSRSRSIEARE
jgi:metal-responsive CopG/Arc/MetJ family transcriptional regulator